MFAISCESNVTVYIFNFLQRAKCDYIDNLVG